MHAEAEQASSEPSAIAAALAQHSTSQRRLGEGDFPEELDRFSWAPIFFPQLWALRRGVWWVFGVWLAQIVIGPIVFRYIGGRPESTVWLALSVLLGSIVLPFYLWLGVNGNRLAWSAAARRDPSGVRVTVGKLIDGEAIWILFGVVFQLVLIGTAVVELFDAGPTLLEVWSFSSEVVYLAAALWLSRHAGGRFWHRIATVST